MAKDSDDLEAFYDSMAVDSPSVLVTCTPDNEDMEVAVHAAHGAFLDALSSLMRSHEGKWVVFARGEVVSAHDDQASAYAATVGRKTPFVVDRVMPKKPVLLSAAVAFSAAARDA